MSFAETGLEPKLLDALSSAGYETPTPIQIEAIPPALEGRDVLGIAQTGTGKTASFTLPMIQRLAKGRAKARMPRSLVLAPTRELAAQVSENFEKYGVNHKLTMALLIGGVSFGDQDAKLTRGVDVLIATPGRLLDHFERGKLLLTGIEVMVVDEADRMLDMGFIPDIERIFKLTPMTRQTLFFSATMPPEIQRITDQFLHNPARVEVAKPATTAETITQRIVKVPPRDDRAKRDALRALIGHKDVKNGIIFCNRKTTVDVVAKSLQKHGFNARPIHGDLAQAFRTETLDKFRSGEIQFLVASDVAARGLDIPDVSHVFNFDVPIHSDDYVHRIGRTGRAGKKGAAMMLVAPADDKHYKSILETIGAHSIAELSVDVDAGDNRPRKAKRYENKDADEKPKTIRPKSKKAAELDTGDKDRKSEKRSRRDGDNNGRDGAVVGLGDHVPDFLMRVSAN
ncbi:MAG: DEAD/DEAH box helicase [Marinicaulis sp.]|nr:DEAD/DEAH box helicase [Marinicaulis sp.]NNE39804.1 DEAD/DEAH box helicase [Marinicaulis sp.]NNL90075.1 DEAD/DEAH box helicase [Marinicaulis sp.]